MTLKLNQIMSQVEAMGQGLAEQKQAKQALLQILKALLHQYTIEFEALEQYVLQAEKVQESVRFNWLGAAPADEAIAEYYPPPPPTEVVTVIASDGSQIHPDRHGMALYYVVNLGAIIYQHGSNQQPETQTQGDLYFGEQVLDEQGLIVPSGVINAKRDLGEIQILADLAEKQRQLTSEDDQPIIVLIDGQLPLRVIELSGQQQTFYQQRYLQALAQLQQYEALIAAYIDRPRSSYVVSLLHLASLAETAAVPAITEASLRQNPFVLITDAELFDDLKPGQRTAIFNQRAKANIAYAQAGHQIHFFYLNTGTSQQPNLARVEIPIWIAKNPEKLNLLQATLLKQCAIAGNYPYALARAHELAIIPPAEREALETMIAVSLRRYGLGVDFSAKQQHKNLLGSQEPFKF